MSELLRKITRNEGDPVRENIVIHDKIAKTYDAAHGEIFNTIEQQRIKDVLTKIVNLLGKSSEGFNALDFGAGTGNLTNHLVNLGLNVTAADVSKKCLEVVNSRYGCKTILLQDGSTKALSSNSYDLVCLYSVLHHVPDYLELLSELDRICTPGGIIYIDHENSPLYWERLDDFKKLYKKISRTDWAKYSKASNYLHKIKSLFIYKYTNEGDIHVWPDDHIEWPKIDLAFDKMRYVKVLESDFLLHKRNYIQDEYDMAKVSFFDTRCVAYKKLS